jgi:DNA-binding CsgD family transcriptional regulator
VELLRGRANECEQLDSLLVRARAGRSGTLIVRGEAGIGKTALLDYASESSAGFRVAHAIGVQSEMEMPFGVLHQLCGRMIDRIGNLPRPQAAALGVTFGLAEGEPPDPFLVGLGTLSLMSEVAEEQPLLCVVDDSQWLDRASAQILAFVARRLEADSVALLIGLRDPHSVPELQGLPEMVVEGLADTDALEVLASAVPGRLDEIVRDRIIAEARGNPLALLELPRSLTADLAGGFALPSSAPPSGLIEDSFLRRASLLPSSTRLLLLVAAAEPTGDPALLKRAASLVGADFNERRALDADGLLHVGARVTFHHPLVRSAIYKAASVEDRQEVHQALAEATDSEQDPDRRAWHRAQASSEPNEGVAAELERSADRAQARGGVAAAAAFLERSAELTPDPARRGGRAIAAAGRKFEAGALDTATDLLTTARLSPLTEIQLAHVELLRAQIAFAANRGSDAPPLLLNAARSLEPIDPGLARRTYLEALTAATFAGRLARGGSVMEASESAQAAPPAPGRPSAPDLLLEGLATRATEGYAAGVPVLKRALSAFHSDGLSGEDGIRWLWLASWVAIDLWDDQSWDVLSTRHVQLVRDAGALTALPIALVLRVFMLLYSGELGAAASLLEEVDVVTEATGGHLAPYGALGLAALRGREIEASELIESIAKEVEARGEGFGLTITEFCGARLYNGLGKYEDTLAAAGRAIKHSEELSGSTWALPEFIEAAVRTGHTRAAKEAFQQLSKMTRASGTDWAAGIEAGSRALLSQGAAAEDLYLESIDRLRLTRLSVYVARAHLLFGEWLRRENRRLDARNQLRIAHEMFDSMGAEAYGQRAARELLATGERVRRKMAQGHHSLTAQETQVARLAAEGHSNPEIGAQLFISRRTVEYHLHKVFAKLGISSRNHLHGALSSLGIEANLVHPRSASPA